MGAALAIDLFIVIASALNTLIKAMLAVFIGDTGLGMRVMLPHPNVLMNGKPMPMTAFDS